MTIGVIGNDYKQQFPVIDYGGIEASVEALCAGLARKGIDFFVVVPRRQVRTDYGFDVVEVDEPPTSESRRDPTHFAAAARRVVAARRPDIILSQSHWSVTAVHDLGIPIICTFQDSCARRSRWLTTHPHVYYRFISESHFAEWAPDEATRRRSFWAYTGMGEDEYAFAPRSGGEVLWVAGFTWGWRKKGLDVVFALAERCPDLGFRIHGAGHDGFAARVERRAAKVSNLRYGGPLRRGDAHRRAFAEARCFLHPTRIPEALGRTMLESMTKGTPVLGFPNGSVPELVQGAGFVGRDVDSLASALYVPYDRRAVFARARRFHVAIEIEVLTTAAQAILAGEFAAWRESFWRPRAARRFEPTEPVIEA